MIMAAQRDTRAQHTQRDTDRDKNTDKKGHGNGGKRKRRRDRDGKAECKGVREQECFELASAALMCLNCLFGCLFTLSADSPAKRSAPSLCLLERGPSDVPSVLSRGQMGSCPHTEIVVRRSWAAHEKLVNFGRPSILHGQWGLWRRERAARARIGLHGRVVGGTNKGPNVGVFRRERRRGITMREKGTGDCFDGGWH